MKVNNIGLGVLVLLLSIGLGLAGAQLPNPSRQVYGPGFFPVLLAVLLAVTGLVLLADGLRNRRGALMELGAWTRDPGRLLRFASIPLSVAFYILCVGTLGFIPTVALLLLALFLLLGVRWTIGLPVALVTALAVHSLFYLGLRVPLPWGLMQAVQW